MRGEIKDLIGLKKANTKGKNGMNGGSSSSHKRKNSIKYITPGK